MASRRERVVAIKLFSLALGGFALCVAAGALMNGVKGAVWGIGAGVVFLLALRGVGSSG